MGVVFAALVAFDPILIAQGRQARMYSMLVLLVLATLLGLAILARRTSPWSAFRERAVLAGIGLCAVAAAWTHPLGVIVLPAALVGLAASGRRRLALVASLVLVVAAAPAVWRAATWRGGPWLRIQGAISTAELALGAVTNLYQAAWLGPVLVLGGAVAGLVLLARRSRPVALAVGVLLVLGLAAAVPAAMARQFGIDRYLVLGRVSLHFGLAALAALLPSPRWRIVLCAVLLALSARLVVEAARFDMPVENRLGQVVRTLTSHVEAGDAVYYYPGFLSMMGEYYQVPGHLRPWPPPGHPAPYAYPRSWLVIGMAAREEPEPYWQMKVLAERHGTRFHQMTLYRLYTNRRAIAARVEESGVTYLTPEGTLVRPSLRQPRDDLDEPQPR